MDVQEIAIDKKQARELYQKYKTHQHYESELDWEVKRTYQLIAQGKIIIQAIESIKQAGVDAKGLPKLALANATARACTIRRNGNGSMLMASEFAPLNKRVFPRKKIIASYGEAAFTFESGTFPVDTDWNTGKRYRRS